MNPCLCKTGFFSLRDCSLPAIAQCASCQRAMCHEHSAVESQFTQCRDCWARQHQSSTGNGDYGDGWAYNYRHRYYSGGYAPIYTGHHYHHYYDDYDTRSFDKREGESDDGSDNPSAGFGDS
jgi:hypothetical protein